MRPWLAVACAALLGCSGAPIIVNEINLGDAGDPAPVVGATASDAATDAATSIGATLPDVAVQPVDAGAEASPAPATDGASSSSTDAALSPAADAQADVDELPVPDAGDWPPSCPVTSGRPLCPSGYVCGCPPSGLANFGLPNDSICARAGAAAPPPCSNDGDCMTAGLDLATCQQIGGHGACVLRCSPP